MITSPHHPEIRNLRALLTPRRRRETGLFVAEGVRQVVALLASEYDVQMLVVAPELLTSHVAWDAVAQFRTVGGACLTVSASVFARISVRDRPQGIAAVASARTRALAELDATTNRLWVALVDPQDPGNLGTIARTCDAVGAGGILVVGDAAVDPYHPRAIRASVGALFTQEIVTCTSDDLLAWARSHGLPLVGTSDRAELDYWSLPPTPEMVLVMGSERQGIPPGMQAALDRMIRIPMIGTCDSLNLAVATSLVLYQVAYRRASAPDHQSEPVIPLQ